VCDFQHECPRCCQVRHHSSAGVAVRRFWSGQGQCEYGAALVEFVGHAIDQFPMRHWLLGRYRLRHGEVGQFSVCDNFCTTVDTQGSGRLNLSGLKGSHEDGEAVLWSSEVVSTTVCVGRWLPRAA
jgi:hypothetical protein